MPPRAATLPLLVLQGSWTEARQLARVTRAQGSPLERQMAVMVLGTLEQRQGNRPRAWEMVSEILPRGPSSEPGDGLFPYAIEMLRLATRLALDVRDVDSAQEWLHAHDEWLAWSGAVRGRAESCLLRARLHLIEGQLERADECLEEALARARAPRQPLALLAIHRVRGQLAKARGDAHGREAQLRRALALAESCSAPYERARVLLDLAACEREGGQSDGSRARLVEVRSIATDLGAAPLLSAADELEACLGSVTVAFDLTERQVEILRLVADGCTDAEVADRLFISPRTVGQHLRTIYNKLGVSSRTAATRLAVEHGIV